MFQNGVRRRGSSVLNSAEPSSWASTKYSLVSDLNGIGDLRKSLFSRIMGFTDRGWGGLRSESELWK